MSLRSCYYGIRCVMDTNSKQIYLVLGRILMYVYRAVHVHDACHISGT